MVSAAQNAKPAMEVSVGEKKKRKVIIVGVAGASGSGKTALSNNLSKKYVPISGTEGRPDCTLSDSSARFNSVTTAISSDWYFDNAKMPLFEDGELNWETPQGVDYDRLICQLNFVKNKLETCNVVPGPEFLEVETTRGPRRLLASNLEGGEPMDDSSIVLFVEGFLLFANFDVVKMCDERIWLEVDCDTALARRFQREKRKWDEELDIFSKWFRDTVWKHYEIYRPLQKSNASPFVIEVLGARGLEDIIEEVSADLKRVLVRNYGYDKTKGTGKFYPWVLIKTFFLILMFTISSQGKRKGTA